MGNMIKDMLKDIYTKGYEVNDFMDTICIALDKYFQNQDLLQKYRSNSEILSAFEFEIRYHNEPEFSEGVFAILKCYRDAFALSPKEVSKIIYSSLSETIEKDNKMLTIRTNAPIVTNDGSYDEIFAFMKYIGDYLEVSIKPIVQELYAMIRISKDLSLDYEKIKSCKFGIIISNILSTGLFESILKTKPINIKLSDWRNISCHFNYKVGADSITCSYGNQKKQFDITFVEFLDHCHQIIRSGNIMNIARTIFIFDNINTIFDVKSEEKYLKFFRKSLIIEDLEISFLSQGFLVDSIREDDDEVKIIILDLKNNGSCNKKEIRDRQIHASQLLLNIWILFKKSIITVIYCNRAKQKIMHISVKGDICKDVVLGKTISHIADFVDFSIIVPKSK